MITGYAIQAHNKIYVVPAQTKRFLRTIPAEPGYISLI